MSRRQDSDDPASGTRQDEVDRLVGAWRGERPDLDLEPMQIFSRVARLARHLDRERRAAFAAHGLEPWEFDVLAALRRAGEPHQLTPGALLQATLVTSGTMTNRIDRLAGAGLVRRLADSRDGRMVQVRLTAEGQARADRAMVDLMNAERRLLAGLSERDRRTLAGLLRELLLTFDDPQPR